jgi:hypothetical protein
MKRLHFQVDIPSAKALAKALEHAHPEASPQWGMMSAPQMLQHVADFGDMYFGEIKVNALTRFAARIIGHFFLRTLTTKNPLGETPRNLPTMPAIDASNKQMAEWESGMERVRFMLKRVEELNNEKQQHPLYGVMHTADFKSLILHHTAHHFHQFGWI